MITNSKIPLKSQVTTVQMPQPVLYSSLGVSNVEC
jgi:hypothetical protein